MSLLDSGVCGCTFDSGLLRYLLIRDFLQAKLSDLSSFRQQGIQAFNKLAEMICLEDSLLYRLPLALKDVQENHTLTIVLANRGIQRSRFDFELAVRAVTITEPALSLRTAAPTVLLHTSSVCIVIAGVVCIFFRCDCEPRACALVINPITFPFFDTVCHCLSFPDCGQAEVGRTWMSCLGYRS